MMFLVLIASGSASLATDELQWISPDGQTQETMLASYGKPAEPSAACPCETQTDCGAASCGVGFQGCGADCDECPGLGLQLFGAVDSFRGVSDGSYQSNFGVVNGVNAGFPIFDTGLAWQLGMSYGIYDFSGRVSAVDHNSACQTQTFITTGFFHKANHGRRLSFGLVYDWMINDNWGEYAIDPTIGQWRGQIEFALNPCSAVGVYGSLADRRVEEWAEIPSAGSQLVRTRAMDQVNLFYRHKFVRGTDARVWIGLPDRERLTGRGSLGEWIAGGQVEVPIGPRFALYGGVQYMKASASPGNGGSLQDSSDAFIGLTYYPGLNARTSELNGTCNVPYLPVANNSSFLVDQTRLY